MAQLACRSGLFAPQRREDGDDVLLVNAIDPQRTDLREHVKPEGGQEGVRMASLPPSLAGDVARLCGSLERRDRQLPFVAHGDGIVPRTSNLAQLAGLLASLFERSVRQRPQADVPPLACDLDPKHPRAGSRVSDEQVKPGPVAMPTSLNRLHLQGS